MSCETALIWRGHIGHARCHGVSTKLRRKPVVPGLGFTEIGYDPQVGIRRIMPVGDGWRDMTVHEVHRVEAHLMRVALANQAMWDGWDGSERRRTTEQRQFERQQLMAGLEQQLAEAAQRTNDSRMGETG